MKWPLLIGLIATFAVLAPLVTGWLGQRRSEREFPAAAARLGIEREGRVAPGRLGTFRGQYRDRRVAVRPDAFGLIRVGFHEPGPALSLSTDPKAVLEEKGLEAFDSGDAAFDRAFPHRYASAELSARLRGSPRARGLLLDFRRARGRQLRTFSVNRDFVSVTISKLHFFHYIPIRDFEPLLGELADLAGVLEPELR